MLKRIVLKQLFFSWMLFQSIDSAVAQAYFV